MAVRPVRIRRRLNSRTPPHRLKYKTPQGSPVLFSYPNGNQRHPLRLLKLDREPKGSKMRQTGTWLKGGNSILAASDIERHTISKPYFSYFILPAVLFPAVLYPAVLLLLLLLLLLCQPRQSPHRSLRSFRRRAGCSDLRGRLAFNCQ